MDRLIDRERVKWVRRYDELLGLDGVRQTAEVAKSEERLEREFMEWG